MDVNVEVYYTTSITAHYINKPMCEREWIKIIEGPFPLWDDDKNPESFLQDLFVSSNLDEPTNMSDCRAMSCGDIVILDKEFVYYCDSNGWTNITEKLKPGPVLAFK